jgi:hypothetical protein
MCFGGEVAEETRRSSSSRSRCGGRRSGGWRVRAHVFLVQPPALVAFLLRVCFATVGCSHTNTEHDRWSTHRWSTLDNSHMWRVGRF